MRIIVVGLLLLAGCSQQATKVVPQQQAAKAEPEPHPLWVAKTEAHNAYMERMNDFLKVKNSPIGNQPQGAALVEQTEKAMKEAEAANDAAEKAWEDAGSPR